MRPKLPADSRQALDADAEEDLFAYPDRFPAEWAAFRRARLTALVTRIRRDVAAVRPRALLTSAVAALVLTPGAAATAEVELAVKPVIGLIGLALGSTALLLVLTFRLIDAVGPRRAALAAYLAPGFALLLAAIVLGEPITVAAVGGLALIVGGVALASRQAPVRL
jgi:drug/metabolite transporter (DMT)-like permease